jgi:hypothetical protein
MQVQNLAQPAFSGVQNQKPQVAFTGVRKEAAEYLINNISNNLPAENKETRLTPYLKAIKKFVTDNSTNKTVDIGFEKGGLFKKDKFTLIDNANQKVVGTIDAMPKDYEAESRWTGRMNVFIPDFDFLKKLDTLTDAANNKAKKIENKEPDESVKNDKMKSEIFEQCT